MTLLDDIARAIEGYHGPRGARYAAQDAIAVFVKYLREPPEELAYQANFLRALADHLEGEK